jgi:LexA-binding, inner membrane-associated putative hydrolase
MDSLRTKRSVGRFCRLHKRRKLVFAINHAATALLIKRRFPEEPITPLLLSVQLMELLWVALNLLGVERTTTEPSVRSVSDIHLAFMPYSHSVAMGLAFAVVAWVLLSAVFHRPGLGLAVALGIVSHLVLDLITHAPDIQIAPGLENIKLGLGLYSRLPLGAFFLEVLYGIFCWGVYKGGKTLLAIIVLFNVANLSLLSPAVPGPESLLANRPTAVVLLIFAQIVVTLFLVGFYSLRPSPSYLKRG